MIENETMNFKSPLSLTNEATKEKTNTVLSIFRDSNLMGMKFGKKTEERKDDTSILWMTCEMNNCTGERDCKTSLKRYCDNDSSSPGPMHLSLGRGNSLCRSAHIWQRRAADFLKRNTNFISATYDTDKPRVRPGSPTVKRKGNPKGLSLFIGRRKFRRVLSFVR